MSDQIFSIAEKLHIVTRRLYADDLRRHFVGEITKASADLCEVQGFAFVFNATMNRYERRPTIRTRVFSLGDPLYIVNKLPPATVLEKLEYGTIDQRLMLVDTTPTAEFRLDINEFNHVS